MTTQTTLFPKTELDEATAVLAHLISEEEKADKAADAAGQKAADTASRVRKQRHVVAKLQAMMPAAEPIVDSETAPEDIEDAEVLQIEGDVLDPITGEVTSKPTVAPYVMVAWPDNLDMQTIDVGPLTRYGELAADFLASLPNDDPRRRDAFTDYRVVDVDADVERDLHAVIDSADYGLEFSVEAIAKVEESAA